MCPETQAQPRGGSAAHRPGLPGREALPAAHRKMGRKEPRCTAVKSKNVLSVLRKTAYNIIRLMQMENPKDREQVIDVMDEITDDISVALKWVFDSIPSFY